MASADDLQAQYLCAHSQASAMFEGRCTIGVCNKTIESEDDHKVCGRCGRSVCATCSSFGVSRFVIQAQGQAGAAEADAVNAAAAASDDGAFHKVCGECLVDMVARLGTAAAPPTLRDRGGFATPAKSAIA